jgi:hypothetical protein
LSAALQTLEAPGPECGPVIGLPRDLGVRRKLLVRFPYAIADLKKEQDDLDYKRNNSSDENERNDRRSQPSSGIREHLAGPHEHAAFNRIEDRGD